jgi:N-acetylmuramoyl-L-alanine amidase
MVTIRPRTDWQSAAQPVVGPRMVLSTVTMFPAHYTAASTVPADTAPYLRAIQNDYTVNRGYSIGYNFAVDRAGVAWELRGFDIKCAANKGANEVTIAVLCLVNGAEAMNAAMVDTFRQLGAEAQRRVGTSLLVVGHRDIGATACPGDGIYGQVVRGELEPASNPVPKPEPPNPDPTPEETDDMPFIITNKATGAPALVYGQGKVTGLDGSSLATFVARYGEPIVVEQATFDDFAAKGA